MTRLLVCGACGGPLPRPAPSVRIVTCQFCGSSSSLDTGTVLQPANVTVLSVVGLKERLQKELGAFEQAFREQGNQGKRPVEAFRVAAESALIAMCDPDAITNVVFGIASDFERAHGVDVTRDANALPRLAAAYLDALEQLRSQNEHELNIPFLSATESGPLHFRQRVTIARLTELAACPPPVDERPTSDQPAHLPPAAPTAPSTAPRPWWRRLFG